MTRLSGMPKAKPKKPSKRSEFDPFRGKGPRYSLRIILWDLGWTNLAVNKLTNKQADQYIAAGAKLTPAVEVEIHNQRKDAT